MSRFRPTYPVKWRGSKALIFDVDESLTKSAFWGNCIAKLIPAFSKLESHQRTTSRVSGERKSTSAMAKHSHRGWTASQEMLIRLAIASDFMATTAIMNAQNGGNLLVAPCSLPMRPNLYLHLQMIWRASRPPIAESTEYLRGIVVNTHPLELHRIQWLITNFMCGVTSCVILAGRSFNKEDFTELKHWGFL